MIKKFILIIITFYSLNTLSFTPKGLPAEIEKFGADGKIYCLKEIDKLYTPILLDYEEEQGVKYNFKPISGLIFDRQNLSEPYTHIGGLRIQVYRIDVEGKKIPRARIDYYWLADPGNMCKPYWTSLDQSDY